MVEEIFFFSVLNCRADAVNGVFFNNPGKKVNAVGNIFTNAAEQMIKNVGEMLL